MAFDSLSMMLITTQRNATRREHACRHHSKIATQTRKYALIQRLLKLYFSSLHSLLSSLSLSAQGALISLCVSESSRLLPYIVSSRPLIKAHLRLVLSFWSSTLASDELRLNAFLALRKVALCADRGVQELTLKGAYLALQAAAKANSSPYALPGLQMMKNTAAQLFASLENTQDLAYTLGFSYIRALAITLRNTMKATSKTGSGHGNTASGAGPVGQKKKQQQEKGKEPYRQVYNWVFFHSLDFWATVLSTACDSSSSSFSLDGSGSSSELSALIYPLVQVTLGVIKLNPTARYYPLRFQLVSSLLRVSGHTGVYIPLAPFLLEVLDSALLSKKAKPASLKPLVWEHILAAPAAYAGTRIYADGALDELVHLVLEFAAAQSTSIAFPELILPITIALRKHAKKTKNTKLAGALRALTERMEANAKFVEVKRDKVEFSPADRRQLEAWNRNMQDETTPLKSYLKVQRKLRDQKRELVEKSMRDNGEEQQNDQEEQEDDEDVEADDNAMAED